jgi:hypothetical protein
MIERGGGATRMSIAVSGYLFWAMQGTSLIAAAHLSIKHHMNHLSYSSKLLLSSFAYLP